MNDCYEKFPGPAYFYKSLYDRAVADFNKSVGADPNFAKAYCNWGVPLAQTGQFDQALPDLNKALGINPRYANAYYNRGLAYFHKSLYDGAIGDFTKSLELDPKLADAYFNKALALEAAGRQKEAKEAYAAFIQHAPPEAKEQIEQARSKVGR